MNAIQAVTLMDIVISTCFNFITFILKLGNTFFETVHCMYVPCNAGITVIQNDCYAPWKSTHH